MTIRPCMLALLAVLGTSACSSSGGGGGGSTKIAPWEKFRHDGANSGQAAGEVADNSGLVHWRTNVDGTPILSSPAIGFDEVVYVATEGGTIAALDRKNGNVNWKACVCSGDGTGVPATCEAGDTPEFGPLGSSPATYFQDTKQGKGTYIFVGSRDGLLLGLKDDGATATCTMQFRPTLVPPGATDVVRAVHFEASPTFTVNSVTTALGTVFAAARIEIDNGTRSRAIGKLYAVNTDGSLSWEFPRPGQPEIGAITASPALDAANILYLTADDGNLYAIDNSGTLRWRFAIAPATEAPAPFAPSPLTARTIYAPTIDGAIVAVNPDGTFAWRASAPVGSRFIASLAVGNPAPSPTPTATSKPTGTPEAHVTRTPTPTATPVLSTSDIFAVTDTGTILAFDVRTGVPRELDMPPAEITGPVVSSPALSGDGYLVVGSGDGRLYAIETTTGLQPTGWPVTLSDGLPIQSSPAIDEDGIVYVGTADGYLSAIGGAVENTPVPTRTVTATGTPTATRTAAAAATPTPSLRPTSG